MNNNSIFNDEFLNAMSVIGFAIGLYNLQLNEKQTDNDTLLKEIQTNRGKLDEQNDIYLKTIIEQNTRILQILEGGKRED